MRPHLQSCPHPAAAGRRSPGHCLHQRTVHAGGPGRRSSELFTGKSISREIQRQLRPRWELIWRIGSSSVCPGCREKPDRRAPGPSHWPSLCRRRPRAGAARGDVHTRFPASPRRGRFPDPGNPGAPGSGERLRADHRHWRRLCHPRGKPPGPAPEWPDHLAATAPGLPDHPGAAPVPGLWAWKNFTSPASPCMPVLPTMWSQTPGPWRIPSGRFWR